MAAVPYIPGNPPPHLAHHLRHLASVPITELDDAAKFLHIEYFPSLTLDLGSPHRYIEFDLHPQDPDKLISLIVVNSCEMIQTPANLTLGYFVIKASPPCRRLLEPLLETLATLRHIPHTLPVPSATPSFPVPPLNGTGYYGPNIKRTATNHGTNAARAPQTM